MVNASRGRYLHRSRGPSRDLGSLAAHKVCGCTLGQCSVVHCIAVQCSVVLCSAVQCIAVECISIKNSAVRGGAVLGNSGKIGSTLKGTRLLKLLQS